MKKKQSLIFESVEYDTESFFTLMHNYNMEGYANHWHNPVEIIMPLQGNYIVSTPDRVYYLNEYDIIVIPPGEQHEIKTPEIKGHRIILQFDISVLNAVRGFINASYIYARPQLVTAENAAEGHEFIKSMLMEMLEENMHKNTYYEVSIINKIIGITVNLARQQQVEDLADYENISKRKEYVAKFNYCVEYINLNYKDNLTLDSISHAVDFSKYHFARWFRQFANMSFNDYLTKVRIEKAESMLLGTTMPVTEIAMEAGFQSIPTFNRIFKKYKKCTPTEYRNFYYLNINNQLNGNISPESKDDSDMIKNDLNIVKQTPPAYLYNDPFGVLPGASRVNKDGTFLNPFLWSDVPDPDVIRVGDVYYMTSTTMHFTPGCPIMKSYDLVNWEIVNYAYDILEDSDKPTLRNGASMYGKGSWASSLRYRNGTFYIVVGSFNTGKTYIFQTEDIENGPWRRYTLDGVYHDMSLLLDDDGRAYLTYNGGTIRIIELTADVTAIKQGGLDAIVIEKANAGGDGGLPAEGSHFYKINGKYYIFLIGWPPTGSGRRIELCYRSDSVAGPYEGRVVLDDDLGFHNMGAAQGGIVNTPDGKWYAMLFQDHLSVGRIPVLVPVTWEDGWPVFGVNGCVPLKMAIPVASGKGNVKSIVTSDEFYQGESKNYAAENDTGYRYGHMAGNGAYKYNGDSDIELILNGEFKEGAAHWTNTDIADITVVNDAAEEAPALFISGRATTGSGPKQDITGKVKQGGVYKVLAYVKYETGPAVKDFNICICNGSSWEGIQVMGSGRVQKGEWGIVKGTYTIPADADVSETSVFVETSWSDKPKKDIDLIDFYVRSVSIIAKSMQQANKTMAGENDYNGSNLCMQWQWNHNPDNNLWSLTERPGYLRLKSGYLCQDIIDARNTLTMRTFGPECSGYIAVELSGMRDGDVTGLAALQDHYGYVGVKMVNNVRYIVMVSAANDGVAQEIESIPFEQERIYLKVDFDFKDVTEKAYFYYSTDEIRWRPIGHALPMKYLLSHFVGYRFALFYYATQIIGGHMDFDYFRVSDKLTVNDENLKVLKAAFGEGSEGYGVCGSIIEIPITMDALPEDSYKGIYISIAVPEYLIVSNVAFCQDNISGSTNYTCEGGRLLLSVTGGEVSFSNKTSDLFAVLIFKVNGFVQEDTIVTLRPDNIYVDGGNVAYQINDMCAEIKLTALKTNAKAKVPGYSNPAISHKFGADPWALPYKDRVYLYLTGDEYEYDSHGKLIDNTYGKINTINVISSADFVNWTDHGAIKVGGPDGAAKWAAHSWAPAVGVKEIDGKDKFFLYFANDASNIGVLTSDSPAGEWSDPIGGPLIHRGIPGVKEVTWCFDPAVLTDDDGVSYLYFGGGLPSDSQEDILHPKTARVIKLGSDMTSVEGEAVAIDPPALFEDSGIHKYNGKYYYSYCSNFAGTHPQGYPPKGEIAYMVSDKPMGPFTYAGTVLKNPEHFFGVGGNNHHCIFEFKGNWYIAYHAQTLGKALGRPKGYRSPHINKLEYYSNESMREVEADMAGESLPVYLNPYERTEAETIAWCAGVSVMGDSQGMYVTEIHDEDWLSVANADFGKNGAVKFTARVASCVGGEIEIRLDSPLGEIIGILGIGSTGGEDKWEEKTCEIKRITGVHNIFFIFKGDSERNLFNFDYWMFGE